MQNRDRKIDNKYIFLIVLKTQEDSLFSKVISLGIKQ